MRPSRNKVNLQGNLRPSPPVPSRIAKCFVLVRVILRIYIRSLWLYFFLDGSPTLFWPWEGPNLPSQSCNGFTGPKGPKFKQNKEKEFHFLQPGTTKRTVSESSNEMIINCMQSHYKTPNIDLQAQKVLQNKSQRSFTCFNSSLTRAPIREGGGTPLSTFSSQLPALCLSSQRHSP